MFNELSEFITSFESRNPELEYDFSLCENDNNWKDNDCKTVTCKKHNYTFTSQIRHILNGIACDYCLDEKVANIDLIKHLKPLYKNKFNYDKCDEKSSIFKPSIITCNKHGDFEMTLIKHYISSVKCPRCEVSKIITPRFEDDYEILGKGPKNIILVKCKKCGEEYVCRLGELHDVYNHQCIDNTSIKYLKWKEKRNILKKRRKKINLT